jgi:hypothetical protein
MVKSYAYQTLALEGSQPPALVTFTHGKKLLVPTGPKTKKISGPFYTFLE